MIIPRFQAVKQMLTNCGIIATGIFILIGMSQRQINMMLGNE